MHYLYSSKLFSHIPSKFPVPDLLLSPKSPSRTTDPLGIRQKVRSILKTIIENHKKWDLAHRRGITLCCAIENIKKQALDRVASEPSETLYPDDMKVPSEKLKTITTIFKDVCDSSKDCLNQLIGLKKLQTDSSNEKLLRTWSLVKLIDSVESVVRAYENEYEVKVTVMENVCHSSSKEEIVFHVSVWEFETFVNNDVRLIVLSMQVECEVEASGQ